MGQEFLEPLKFQVAQKLPHFPPRITSEAQFQNAVDKFKYEVARELGIPLSPGYNGDLPTREAGRIGGKTAAKSVGTWCEK